MRAWPDIPADVIVVSERVLTIHPDTSPAIEAVAIKGKRIQRLLKRAEIGDVVGPQTRIVDVGKRTVMPGFVDPHAHVEVACRASHGTVDCRAPECATIEDILEALSAKAANTPKGRWVVGQGNLFLDRKLAEGRLPTSQELDRVSRDHPVALRAGGHITVLNSKALKVSLIDRHYNPPDYSITGLPHVEHDHEGEPTGVVKEMDNLLSFSTLSRDELRSAIREGVPRLFTQYGVTTIGEISETVEGVEVMDELICDGEFGPSLRVYLWAPGTLPLKDACRWRQRISLSAPADRLKIQGVKLFADGGYSAKSAAVKQPYLCACKSDRPFRGEIALTKEFANQAIELTGRSDLQLAVHANGDRAQEWLCDAILEAGGAKSGPMRARIEHAGNLLPSNVTADKWANAGIIPVPQPVFIYTFGEYFPDYLGDYGRRGRFHFASLLRQGWRLSGSSDVWIGSEREATNPLFSVWCCVKRETYSGHGLDTEEALTVEQALRLHTLDAAAVLGEDDVRGSLAPGKIADIIVLDRDPLTVPIDDLRRIKVDLVFALGRQVWSRQRTLETVQ
jgi:predicted amidohydrolase YtcJ